MTGGKSQHGCQRPSVAQIDETCRHYCFNPPRRQIVAGKFRLPVAPADEQADEEDADEIGGACAKVFRIVARDGACDQRGLVSGPKIPVNMSDKCRNFEKRAADLAAFICKLVADNRYSGVVIRSPRTDSNFRP